MSCSNSDILALIDYFENGTDLSNNDWDNYNYYDLWNALENGASPPSRTVCATFTQADILSITLAVLGTFTTPSEYLGFNRDFYYLYLKAIGSEDPSPTFTNECIGALYDVFTVGQFLLDAYPNAALAYSVRLLKSDYTGALIRIRRASDNSEDDFYPDSNNELSLSSTNLAGTSLSSFIGSENGFIVTFYDQSGNSRNSTQSTAANQTQIINAGSLILENGKPITSSGATTTYPISYVIDGTNRNVLFVGKRGPVLSCLIGSSGGGSDLYMMSQSGSTSNGVFNATQVSTRINGSAATITDRASVYTEFTPQVILNGLANFTYGGRPICLSYNNATAGFGTMNFQELVIWESSQGTGIETNANNFYNVY